MNRKNVTAALIMALVNALVFALFRSSPSGREMIGFAYGMIGITTLIIIWMLFPDND